MLLPIELAAEMIANPMSPAISEYSIDVAPLSSSRKRLTYLITGKAPALGSTPAT